MPRPSSRRALPRCRGRLREAGSRPPNVAARGLESASGCGIMPRDCSVGSAAESRAMTTPMRDIPRHDRPRERLLQLGAAALSDAELLAVQLGSGRVGANAVDVAHRLLATIGGLGGLTTARPAELARVEGIGPAKAARLLATFEIAARLKHAADARPRLERSSDIAREAARTIGRARVEHVLVLVADGGLRLRHSEVVAIGSARGCPMPVREVLATVLRHDGSAFAVAHNHPCGDPSPSAADRAASAALMHAAHATGLRLLDHVVIAGDEWRSAGS